jgi:hypothetical protein
MSSSIFMIIKANVDEREINSITLETADLHFINKNLAARTK